jgi:toxin FitB
MFVLDTNVVSELRKVATGRAHPSVARWAENVDAATLYVSAITLQELEIGVLLAERRDAAQGAMLRIWLNEQVIPTFEGRVLDVTAAVAIRSARLHVPNPTPLRDGLIAATALVHRMTVVTRNVAGFAGSGVAVLNPWDLIGRE